MAKKQEYDIDEVLANMPAGLDRAVLRILGFHQGRDKAIKKQDFIEQLGTMGFRVRDERILRAQIDELQRQGHLICSSSSSKDGGYYLAGSWEEVAEFDERELTPRLASISEKRSIMRRKAEELWGPPSTQIKLF